MGDRSQPELICTRKVKVVSDLLICVICLNCGLEHYFELDSLPGGLEHCSYCEKCGEKLPELDSDRS